MSTSFSSAPDILAERKSDCQPNWGRFTPSKRGCPHGNAAGESASKALKAEVIYRESFEGLRGLQVKLSDYAWRHDNERMRSTLGCMSPVEFREAGLSL